MEAGSPGPGPVVAAIRAAESQTTGEIRVHFSSRWWERDCYGSAQQLFDRHQMYRTTHRNAVLIYVNLKRRKFAIIGDQGIHSKVGQVTWEALARDLSGLLKTKQTRIPLGAQVAELAIAPLVRRVGELLKQYFPLEEGAHPVNELPDHPV